MRKITRIRPDNRSKNGFDKFLFLGLATIALITTAFIINNKSFRSLNSSKAAPTRPMKYYLVDRVRNNGDFATLASWGVNSAVVAIPTNGSTTSWQSIYDAAHAANVGIIIWPLDPQGDNECGWESPFHNPQNGNYIGSVTNMLTWWANKPGVLGIVTFHEPMWESSSGCKDSISDLSSIYQQIHSYTNNSNFEVYGYVDNIVDAPQMGGFQSFADMDKIMDVAVTWHHCAGGVEGPCEGGSNSALSKINNDRIKLTSVNSDVKLVFLIQTFTMGSGYGTKFTLSELENYSKLFIDSNNLDGFGYYTWDEGWYSGNLKRWTDLHPAVLNIYNYFKSSGTTTPTANPSPTTVVNTPTGVPSNTPSVTPTPRPSSTPTPRPTNTPTVTPRPTSTPTPRPTNTPSPRPTATSTPVPTITPVPSKIMSVSSVTYDVTRSWFRGKRINVHIKVIDKSSGNGLLYTWVKYTVKNKNTGRVWEKSGYTNLGGIEEFSISNPVIGCYQTTVTQITRGGNWTWDKVSPSNEFCYSN